MTVCKLKIMPVIFPCVNNLTITTAKQIKKNDSYKLRRCVYCLVSVRSVNELWLSHLLSIVRVPGCESTLAIDLKVIIKKSQQRLN